MARTPISYSPDPDCGADRGDGATLPRAVFAAVVEAARDVHTR